MKQQNEVNVWSVTWGVLMAVLFSAAAAYLGLKVGQVFEAAIPIAIIAVGVSTAAKRNNALRENVIIQSIGACSGAVVAGAIFGKFQGLKESQAREEIIMAKHHATAEGICSQNEVKYLAAHTMEEMEQGISQLIHAESERPMLLEVFTDMDVDNEMLEAIQKC